MQIWGNFITFANNLKLMIMFQVRIKGIKYGIRDFFTKRKALNYAKSIKGDFPNNEISIYELGIVGERKIETI